MKRHLIFLGCLISAAMPSLVTAQNTPTQRVPMCRVERQGSPYFAPCTGTVPVDSATGNVLSWQELLNGTTTDSGTSSDKSNSVQNADGSKIAADTTVNGLFKAGQSIGNTAFGAKLQDATGAALGTSANPVYVTGGAGGSGGTPTGTAGTPNAGVVTVQGITGGVPVSMGPLATGSNVVGSIANTGFAINGTLPSFNTVQTFNLGTLNGAATAAKQDSLLTALGTPFQAGGSIANTAFGISGQLPSFATTPTFNLGTLNGAATAAKQDTLVTALGTPFQSGGSIGNTYFGARLQDPSGVALGTSTNPVYVTGGAGGGSVPTGTAGTPNAAVVSVQGVTGGSAIPVTGTISNTAFGISGTLPAFASTPTVNIGTAPTLNVNGTVTANLGTLNGAATSAKQDSMITALGSPFQAGGSIGNTTFASTQSGSWNVGLNAGTNAIGSITNTAFGISGTLPAFAATPTFNIGTAPSLTIGSSALPTGAATATNQATMNTSIGSTTDVAATTTDATATSLIAQSKQLVNRVNALITALGTPSQAGVPVSNVINATAVNRGASVGTTAVTLMAANAVRKGWSIQVQSTSASCYVNGTTTATADFNSLQIGPGGYFEPDHHVGVGAISIICTGAATPVYAREW